MNEETKQHRFRYRVWASCLTAFSFLLIIATGTILYVTPKGRVAHWVDWQFLGLDKEQWGAVHITVGITFAIAGVVHLLINWKVFWGYLARTVASGRRTWREVAMAGAISAVVVIGTVWEWPPFEQILQLNACIKADWDQTTNDILPYAHAEDSSLREFADRTGIGQEELAAALNAAGFTVSDMEIPVGELAKRNSVSPSALFGAIRDSFPQTEPQRGMGMGMGRGAGRNALGTDDVQ